MSGWLLLSKTAVSELGERLWEDYQAFMRNRFRKQLTPPDKQLAWRDAVFARDLRCRPAGPRRFRHDPKLRVPAPAPPPLN